MPASRRSTAAATTGRFRVRDLCAADAAQVSTWRYAGPWSVYSSRAGDPPISAAAGYFAVVDAVTGEFVGFGCTGAEARVPGVAADDSVLDVGLGLRPALTGQGLGPAFAAAVIAHVRERHGDRTLRALVQDWNERSLRLTRRLGFTPHGTHTCVQDGHEVVYQVLLAVPDRA
jgi:ribosomal-protein-alanine N-acetyltransferase